MKRQSVASVLAVSLIALVGLGGPLSANAKWERTHAFDCKTLGGSPAIADFSLFNASTSALFNASAGQDMVVLCAIPDDDRFPKEKIARVNVHGYDGHTSLRVGAMACRSLWSGTGGSCGPMAQSASSQENYLLRPSLSQWTSSTRNDFGYLWVRIPRKGAAMSSVRGYFATE